MEQVFFKPQPSQQYKQEKKKKKTVLHRPWLTDPKCYDPGHAQQAGAMRRAKCGGGLTHWSDSMHSSFSVFFLRVPFPTRPPPPFATLLATLPPVLSACFQTSDQTFVVSVAFRPATTHIVHRRVTFRPSTNRPRRFQTIEKLSVSFSDHQKNRQGRFQAISNRQCHFQTNRDT